MNFRPTVVLLAIFGSALSQVTYMNSPTLLVHSLNEYNTPKFREAIKDFRST